MIGSGETSVERNMLLKNRGAARDRCHWNCPSLSMVREAHRDIERVAERIDGQKIHRVGRRRIANRAVKNGGWHFVSSEDRYCLFNFREAAHTGREDRWLPLCSHVFEQWQVREVVGGYFVRRHAQAIQEVHARLVERGRQEGQSMRPCEIAEFGMPLRSQLEAPEQVRDGFSLPHVANQA